MKKWVRVTVLLVIVLTLSSTVPQNASAQSRGNFTLTPKEELEIQTLIEKLPIAIEGLDPKNAAGSLRFLQNTVGVETPQEAINFLGEVKNSSVLEPMDLPENASNPQAAECFIFAPFGLPGWVLGATCVIITLVAIGGALTIISLVSSSSQGPPVVNTFAVTVPEPQVVTTWLANSDGKWLYTEVSIYPFNSTLWEENNLFAVGAEVDLALDWHLNPQDDFLPHLQKHTNAKRAYDAVFAATRGGYTSPYDPNDSNKYQCLKTKFWRRSGRVFGQNNKWTHDRIMMARRDMLNGNWRVLIWGIPGQIHAGSWYSFVGKLFVISAYETHYSTEEEFTRMLQYFIQNQGYVRCNSQVDMDGLPPLPPWPPGAAAAKLYLPATMNGDTPTN